MTKNTELDDKKKASRAAWAGVVSCTILSIVIGLGAVWWWAILGMTAAVGTAIGVTIGAILLVAFMLGIAGDELEKEIKRTEYGDHN